MLETKETVAKIIQSKGILKDNTNIIIGSDNDCQQAQDCSVVTATYKVDNEQIGRISFIGPTRMDYSRIYSIINYMNILLNNKWKIKRIEGCNILENKDVQSEVKNETNASVEEQVTEEVKTEQTEDDNVTDINSKLEEKKVDDQIKDLQSKVEASEDKYKRLQAEYSNYIRRTQQEKETIGVFANEKIITELIPVIDNMERALDACPDKEEALYKGVDLVYKQLKDSLVKFGVEEIEAQDADFDPNVHMAVMQESIDGVEPNKVVMVLQKGYKLGAKVIRPTMVKVSC